MLAFITHPDCHEHNPGPEHPDQPERLSAIENQLIMSGLEFVIRYYDAPRAKRHELARVHDPGYIDSVYAMASSGKRVEIDGDTVMSHGTLRAAERAAGAGVLAVDLVMKNESHAAFCEVRPPGHHAERARAMGFCLFNNIAVAAAHALESYGLTSVAIVDFDAHHGNGTENIFKDDPRVLFCSSFQHPFYPFTGHEKETANLVDVPLRAGADGEEFRAAINERWLPALDMFKPQFLFVSAGFDAHVADDISHLQMTDGDYRWITERLVEIAKTHAEGRIVSMLEGGYEPPVLGRSVAAHIDVLIG